MLEKKKTKKAYGYFLSQKNADALKKAQRMRLLYMYLSTLTLAAALFVPQEWAAKAVDIIWLQSLYAFIVFALIVISVIVSFTATRSQNLTERISEKYRPKLGFEKMTFASLEWFTVLHALYALFEIGAVIYGFGIWGLFGALLATAGAVLAFLCRKTVFDTLKDDLIYVPPVLPEEDKTEE